MNLRKQMTRQIQQAAFESKARLALMKDESNGETDAVSEGDTVSETASPPSQVCDELDILIEALNDEKVFLGCPPAP